MEKIIIFDTTLRDGEQAPGASMMPEQKLELAFQLERLAVDVIEAGFPVSSAGDFKAVELVSRNIKKCIICGLARCIKQDIEAANDSLRRAKSPRIHIFLATSKIHLKYKFKKAEDEILELAKTATRMARKLCADIEFSPEDATRSDRAFLFKVIETAIKEGAQTINIPDTVGYSYPQEIFSLITDIKNNVRNINKAVLSIHCHDDLGMAAANSLSAVLAGARQAHCTINGIGERAGNASLEEVVMSIKTRKDVFKNLYTQINTKELFRASRLVSSITDFIVPANKAIVGKNAFRHEAGIHQDAVLKKRQTYEIMDPTDIGIPESQLVLGKHSGRHAFRERLKSLGFSLIEEQLNRAFERFKEIADKKKDIFDDDLRQIVEDEIRIVRPVWQLNSFDVHSGTKIKPEATVILNKKNKLFSGTSFGDGPVDACFRAIDKIVGCKGKLEDYRLESVTSGKDALGQVSLKLNIPPKAGPAKAGKNKIISGRGLSTDIIEASIRAYLDAINKLTGQ